VVLVSVLIYSIRDFAAFPGLNAFVMVYGVALHSQRRQTSLIAFGATMLVMTVAVLLQPPGVVDQATWISTELATVVAWLGGDNLRQRRARWAALRERNEFLEREREERARKAVVDERLRIARELHDVVAHAMSVIAVQSGVGNHVIETQPAEAKKALEAIETTSRSVLIEMRRLLGILRQDGESDADLVPAPGLRDVPTLIRHVADGGVTTGLRITGAPREIPAGVDLSAYRIVQEALTNAIKHGGPRADVTLSYTEQDVSIEVTNDEAPSNNRGQYVVLPGHGLIGMRERVAVYDGEFSAQRRPGGGFRVAARLPFLVSKP
jgi:signal transduction histidine kinase